MCLEYQHFQNYIACIVNCIVVSTTAYYWNTFFFLIHRIRSLQKKLPFSSDVRVVTALIKTHAIPDSVCLLCAAAAGEHLHHNIICTVYNNIISVYGRSPRRWKSHVHNIYMNAYNMSARTNRRKAYNIVCTKRT